ncbi:MAG: hypothetical protein QNJ36_12250 [Calothrix sp. MO_167.B42]|nr:hypothetical protein [Calothrix sp. MO_167.B42]
MTDCPCCSHTLLQHIRKSGTYWFCRHCWQEMPRFSENRSISLTSLFPEPVSSNQETSNTNQIALPNVQQSSQKEWIGVEDLSELLYTTP